MKRNYFLYLMPPILITIFPVLSLFEQNAESVLLGEVAIFATATVSLTIAIISFFSLIFKNLSKGSLFATYLLLFFYYFHHMLEAFNSFTVSKFGYIFFRMRYILIALVTFSLWFFLKILRTKSINLFFFNIISIIFGVLMSFSITNIAITKHQTEKLKLLASQHMEQTFNKLQQSAAPEHHHDAPDIYFIILDMYASSKTLKKFYNYDNSHFLEKLQEKGFIVSEGSKSNYSCTATSVPATFNMTYHLKNTLIPRVVKQNNAFHFLKNHGYSFIDISSPSRVTCSLGTYGTNRFFQYFYNSFKNLMCTHDFIYQFIKSKTFLFYVPAIDPLEVIRHKKITLEQVEQLKKTTSIESPKFVFCHFLCPHSPFIAYKKNPGEASNMPGIEQYIKQVQFTNAHIYPAIEHILKKSKKPPIIILQGDHGIVHDPIFLGRKTSTNPFPTALIKQSFSIFNAWHLPKCGRETPNPPTSPINNFRFIFDRYFGANIGFLPDRSFMHRQGNLGLTIANVDSILDGSYKSNCLNIETLFED